MRAVKEGRHFKRAVALIYVGLGDTKRAFEWQEEMYRKRSGGLIHSKVLPMLEPLRSDPRFQPHLRRLNFPE